MSMVAEQSAASLAQEIVEHLRGVRDRLAAEIRDYPTPIPRCDAQFNHLYEQLGRLARDIDELEGRPAGIVIERFLATKPYTDDPSEGAFRERVAAFR